MPSISLTTNSGAAFAVIDFGGSVHFLIKILLVDRFDRLRNKMRFQWML